MSYAETRSSSQVRDVFNSAIAWLKAAMRGKNMGSGNVNEHNLIDALRTSFELGGSRRQIGMRIGMDQQRVSELLREHGMITSTRKKPKTVTVEQFIAAYNLGGSYQEIADRLDASYNYVRKLHKKAGVQPHRKRPPAIDIPPNKLKEIKASGTNRAKAAAELGVSESTLYRKQRRLAQGMATEHRKYKELQRILEKKITAFLK